MNVVDALDCFIRPIRGRELLAKFVSPLVMTPEGENPDRSYRATGAFDLSFFLGPQGRGFGESGCAGALRSPIYAVFDGFEVVLGRVAYGRDGHGWRASRPSFTGSDDTPLLATRYGPCREPRSSRSRRMR
jgi:hypothetical protein